MNRIGRLVCVNDPSAVADARRAATQCSEALQLGPTAVGRAALVATELATNLVKHGDGGSIVFGSDHLRPNLLTILALDKGRGLTNLAAAMRDGYSTAGSAGNGLGAIKRSSSLFDIYALPDRGTAILCHIEDESAAVTPVVHAPARIVIGGICIAMPREEVPGDSWTATTSRDVATVSIADGLGHGEGAAIASLAAVRIFADSPEATLVRLMEDAHAALRPTRGAAVGISRIYAAESRLDFAGVGNIAATIISDESTRRVVTLNGIVGHEMRKVQTFSYPWSASSVLVMQSDGIGTSWNMANYPGLLQHEPALIAGVLYRDYVRGNDDATVVVAKAS